jgi:hypothetical protein
LSPILAQGNLIPQSREYTRFQIQRLLEQKDFTVATKKELQMALKLLKEQARLMEKN